MKFDYIIGNPPYQGDNHQQIYTDFYLTSKQIANCVDLIFPVGWQAPKNANNLSKLNKPEIKEDKQIVFIDNKQNVFNGIPGAEWTNIVLWKKGYDNGLDGNQKIYTNGKDPKIIKLLTDKKDIKKPKEIVKLAQIVTAREDFMPLQDKTSVRKPYGLSTDVLDNPAKYKLPEFYDSKTANTDLTIYGLKNRKQVQLYLPITYPLPKKSNAIDKYKVFIGKAWGNFSNTYLGGSYADIVIASPNEICTENYLESGCFDDFETAQKHAKYLMTQFTRALLYMNKHTQDNSKDKWASVPVQDYSEEWWDNSIEEIDKKLMEKYNIPQDIQNFIKANIQIKTEKNIVNYKNDKTKEMK